MIGASTGWIFAHTDSVQKQVECHKWIGDICDGIELNISTPERFNFYLSQSKEDLGIADLYTSFHLPTTATDSERKKIYKLNNKYQPDSAILHPTENVETQIELYKNNDVPVVIENMDVRKQKYTELYDIHSLQRTHSIPVCIDIQHLYEAYQNSVPIELQEKQISLNIKQAHISGESPVHNHTLVHLSDNAETIVEIYNNYFSQTPVIIEGEYNSRKQLQNETDYLKNKLVY